MSKSISVKRTTLFLFTHRGLVQGVVIRVGDKELRLEDDEAVDLMQQLGEVYGVPPTQEPVPMVSGFGTVRCIQEP